MNNDSIIKALPYMARTYARMFGVKIEVKGNDAYTTGKTIVIPALNVRDPNYARLTYGYLAHEAAHIKYSDFEVLDAVYTNHLLTLMINAIEDSRIEKLISRRYIGVHENLVLLNEYLTNDFIDKIPFLHQYSKLQIILCFVMFKAQSIFMHYQNSTEIYHYLYSELSNLVNLSDLAEFDKVSSKIGDCTNTLEVFQVAYELYRILLRPKFFVPNFKRFVEHYGIQSEFDKKACETLAYEFKQDFFSQEEAYPSLAIAKELRPYPVFLTQEELIATHVFENEQKFASARDVVANNATLKSTISNSSSSTLAEDKPLNSSKNSSQTVVNASSALADNTSLSQASSLLSSPSSKSFPHEALANKCIPPHSSKTEQANASCTRLLSPTTESTLNKHVSESTATTHIINPNKSINKLNVDSDCLNLEQDLSLNNCLLKELAQLNLKDNPLLCGEIYTEQDLQKIQELKQHPAQQLAYLELKKAFIKDDNERYATFKTLPYNVKNVRHSDKKFVTLLKAVQAEKTAFGKVNKVGEALANNLDAKKFSQAVDDDLFFGRKEDDAFLEQKAQIYLKQREGLPWRYCTLLHLDDIDKYRQHHYFELLEQLIKQNTQKMMIHQILSNQDPNYLNLARQQYANLEILADVADFAVAKRSIINKYPHDTEVKTTQRRITSPTSYNVQSGHIFDSYVENAHSNPRSKTIVQDCIKQAIEQELATSSVLTKFPQLKPLLFAPGIINNNTFLNNILQNLPCVELIDDPVIRLVTNIEHSFVSYICTNHNSNPDYCSAEKARVRRREQFRYPRAIALVKEYQLFDYLNIDLKLSTDPRDYAYSSTQQLVPLSLTERVYHEFLTKLKYDFLRLLPNILDEETQSVSEAKIQHASEYKKNPESSLTKTNPQQNHATLAKVYLAPLDKNVVTENTFIHTANLVKTNLSNLSTCVRDGVNLLQQELKLENPQFAKSEQTSNLRKHNASQPQNIHFSLAKAFSLCNHLVTQLKQSTYSCLRLKPVLNKDELLDLEYRLKAFAQTLIDKTYPEYLELLDSYADYVNLMHIPANARDPRLELSFDDALREFYIHCSEKQQSSIIRASSQQLITELGKYSKSNSASPNNFNFAPESRRHLLHNKFVSSISNSTQALRKVMYRKVKAYMDSKQFHILKGKDIDVRRAVLIPLGEQHIFKDRALIQDFSTSVHLLVDVSGSMGYAHNSPKNSYILAKGPEDSRFYQACKAALSIALALEGIHGVTTLATYFPGYMKNSYQEILRATDKASRVAPFFYNDPHGATPMEQAIMFAIEKAETLNCQRNIILIITDGQPNSIEQTRYALSLAKERAIEVYAIGTNIQDEHKLFENFQSLNDFSNLSTVVSKLIIDLFKVHAQFA